jgi:hypothetical protein
MSPRSPYLQAAVDPPRDDELRPDPQCDICGGTGVILVRGHWQPWLRIPCPCTDDANGEPDPDRRRDEAEDRRYYREERRRG